MATFQKTKINPKHFHRSQIKFYIILAPLALFMILPIIYLISTAFKPVEELFLFPPTFLVRNPTLDNFRVLFDSSTTTVPMARYLFNSLIVTSIVMFLSILFSTTAGYALSKMQFRGKKVWLELNTIALMFVGASIAITRYLIVAKLGLIDSMWAHILPLLAIPVGLFLVKQFIDQVPDALVEAAKIDGASEFRVYRSIILPIISPAIATVCILSFQTVWNNVETSQLYINEESMKTFAFYMNTLSGTNSVAGQGVAAAASLIMFLPNLIIFIFLQSKVMSTVAHSGIK